MGDTAEFNFVNYTSSVKVAFLLDETSPQPQWDRFSVWARNSQTEVNRQGLESGDAITFFIPNENLQVGLSGPQNYLTFPQYYDVAPGDSVAFNVKYARVKVTGKLHGFPGQLQNDGIFAHSAGDYPNFYSNWSQISSDSSYTLWVTDGEWYLNPPFVQGYNISALDTMIVVPDKDTTFTVDFYYSPVTGIDGKGEHVIKTFNLEQNYPNPFNPETTISFTIPDAGNIQLEVYNLLGEKVETVVNSWMTAGFHTVRWNASKFPSGIYFYRLSDLHHHAIRKMMLVK
ncbi:MAG: T9SS type A sorting domain-containing protein [Calditrichota bacterium]